MSVGTRKSGQMMPLEAVYEAFHPFISATSSVWTVDMSLQISDDPTNDKLCFVAPWPRVSYSASRRGCPRLRLGLPLPLSSSGRISSTYVFPIPSAGVSIKAALLPSPLLWTSAQTPGLISAYICPMLPPELSRRPHLWRGWVLLLYRDCVPEWAAHT